VENYLLWTLYLAAGANLLSSLEFLKVREHFRDDGLCAWRVLQWKFSPATRRRTSFLARERASSTILIVRLVSSAWVLLDPSSFSALSLMFFSSVLFHVRNHPLLLDSGDEMLLVVSGALLLQALPLGSSLVERAWLQQASLIFIASQAVLSYFVAGCCKWKARWGRGVFLADLLDCRLLVDAQHADWLQRHSWLLPPMEVQVMVMQLSAPGLFFLGPEFAAIFLLWSFVFHLLGAVGLGLRTFSHAYLACYPSLIYLSC